MDRPRPRIHDVHIALAISAGREGAREFAMLVPVAATVHSHRVAQRILALRLCLHGLVASHTLD